MSLPPHSPPRPEKGAANLKSRFRGLSTAVLTIAIFILTLAGFARWLDIVETAGIVSRERTKVNIYVKTTCNVEGFPDYTVYRDNQDHWRGFCLNADTAYEIPMHPDLNLIQQR